MQKKKELHEKDHMPSWFQPCTITNGKDPLTDMRKSNHNQPINIQNNSARRVVRVGEGHKQLLGVKTDFNHIRIGG